MSPGSGKSHFVQENSDDFVDSDKLLLDAIRKYVPNFTINEKEHPGQNILRLYGHLPQDRIYRIYDKVGEEMQRIVANKSHPRTVLTGSHRFLTMSDYAFIQHNPEILQHRTKFDPSKERTTATRLDKYIPIFEYADAILRRHPNSV